MTRTQTPRTRTDAATEDDATDEDDADRPQPIHEARRRGAPPRRRGPGGPDDGGSGRLARAGRRMGLWIAIALVIAIFLLFSVGIDLWTDALWFKSVGFDPVFWTRLTATVGLGVGAFLVAAIVLLGNLWLAGRLAPASSGGSGGQHPVVRGPDQRGRPGRGPAARRRARRSVATGTAAVTGTAAPRRVRRWSSRAATCPT